ncbi:MAG TPA: tetratricopeptide repeat protein [Burkholderiales bacterium]|nr:tetratricopeptide repeat protein [Burkholderiales bacterium]
MSLINQVLKDLERRHAGQAGVARAVRPLPSSSSGRAVWIVIASLSTAVAAGALWWYLMPSTSVPGKVAGLADAPMHSASAAAPPSSAPPPAAASGASPPSPAPTAAQQASPAAEGAALKAPAAAEPSPQEVRGLPQGPPAAKARRETRQPGSAPARLQSQQRDSVAHAADAAPAPQAPSRGSEDVDTRQALEGPAKSETTSTRRSDASALDQGEAASNIARQERAPTLRERAEADFREALAALSTGDTARAEEKLRAALSIDPLGDKARQALLGLYINGGRRDEAELLLDERLRLDAKQAGFALALARLQLERNASSEALATLERSLSVGQASADYQAMLANALGRLGRHREAAERYQAAARLAPRNPVWLMGTGIELRADNRLTEARAAFQQARELGGLNPQLAGFVEQQLRELR